jgi:hypothetical protein
LSWVSSRGDSLKIKGRNVTKWTIWGFAGVRRIDVPMAPNMPSIQKHSAQPPTNPA